MHQPPPPPASRPGPSSRRIVPWVVGGVCLLLALMAAVVVAIGAVWFFVLREGPEDAVESYVQAWEELDCELLEENTTERFRGEDYTCEDWRRDLSSGPEVLDLEVDIGEAEVEGDTATVRVTESITDENGTQRFVFDYHLVRQDGGWRVDDTTPIEDD